jgi:phytoene synthase
MQAELASSYRCAESVARSRARNFYYTFVALPAAKRRALCAIYAFMRYCDDVSDGSEPPHKKRELLRDWRAQLDATLEGDCRNHPILPAFRDTLLKFSIPGQYFHWIIDGAEMDLFTARYQTFQELYQYCFRVASAVGLVCIQVFGYGQEKAKEYAEQCGIAFQLTNILRDLKEDAQMGRVYLPLEDLARFAYSSDDLRRGIVDERFHRLMEFETSRANEYYRRARPLLPLVHPESRPALWAMMEIYQGILNKIRRNRFDVFQKRIRLTGPEKARIALKAMALRLAPQRIG